MTPAVTPPQGHDGLRVQRMAVWWTCRAPSLGRHVPRELLRNTGLDFPPLIPTTACHQSNDVTRYRRDRKGPHEVRKRATWCEARGQGRGVKVKHSNGYAYAGTTGAACCRLHREHALAFSATLLASTSATRA